ncbi:hypothetical protein BAUCODRAFT_55072, partial [Baudoinia panamericana UAMH 10762]
STPPPSDTAAAAALAPTNTNTSIPPQQQAPQPQQPAAVLDPETPRLSTTDDGSAKRPRDARTIHLVLSSLGITSYQERVPLQLLDFAYRYTSGLLSDSLRLASEGYSGRAGGGGNANANAGSGSGNVNLQSLRQAIASRQGHTFRGHLPKEFMAELAAERNRVALPRVERGLALQLPEEKYCLTGVGWDLRGEWESE